MVAASNQVRLRLERMQSSSCASAAQPADVSSRSSGASAAQPAAVSSRSSGASAAQPADVSSAGQSASAEDSGVSASGRVGGGSSSALRPQSSSQAAGSGANRDGEPEEMKSIEEVAQWLETLPDLTVDAELVKTHEALVVVREEEPAQKRYGPL